MPLKDSDLKKMQSDSYPRSVGKGHLISSIRSIPYTIQVFLSARLSDIRVMTAEYHVDIIPFIQDI